jgi:FKBP-type peptidyl-prolyl cis-trans isomerase FklB
MLQKIQEFGFKLVWVCTVLASGSVVCHAQSATDKPPALSAATAASDNAKLNYAWAARIGKENADNLVKIDETAFLIGFDDGHHDRKPLMTEQQAGQLFLLQMQKNKAARKQKFDKLTTELSKIDGQMTRSISQKPALIKLQDGLYYEVLKPGSGATPKYQDTVTVELLAKKPDGSRILNARSTPMDEKLYLLPTGLSEALQHMKIGDTWRIYMVSQHLQVNGSPRTPPAVMFPDYAGAMVVDVTLKAVM